MKKTYITPCTTKIILNMQHQLLAGSDQSFGDLSGAGQADDDTKNGGWNSRGGSFFDDDE